MTQNQIHDYGAHEDVPSVHTLHKDIYTITRRSHFIYKMKKGKKVVHVRFFNLLLASTSGSVDLNLNPILMVALSVDY